MTRTKNRGILSRKSRRANSRFDFINTKLNIAKSKRSTHVCAQDKTLNLHSRKRSQVTIFIIVAIIIVAAIIGFFVFFKPKILTPPQIESPEAYIEKCMGDAAEDAIDILSQQGGDIEPAHYITYQNEKVRYLCYTVLYYTKCTNQEPSLKAHVESEITGYALPMLKRCVSSLKADFEKQGYAVQADVENIALKTEIMPKNVVLNAEFEFSATKGETTVSRNKFEAVLKEPLYELLDLTREIINQEAKFGYFEQVGYMILYPDYSLEKDNTEETKIYTLKQRDTGREFVFALRGYVLPAGL